MTTLRSISLRVSELFDLIDEAVQMVPDEQKSPILSHFCSMLKSRHQVKQSEIDESLRLLAMKEDCKKGFVNTDGSIKRKVVVATRMVPVSQAETMGDNGLMWRDARQ
jgi:hypothetical protein